MGTLNFLDRFFVSLCALRFVFVLVFVIGFPSLHNTTNKSRKSKSKSKSKSYVNSSTLRLPRLISPNSLSKVTFSRVSSLDRPCHTEIDSSRFFYGGKFGACFFSCFVYKLCCLVSEKILGGNFKFCWFFFGLLIRFRVFSVKQIDGVNFEFSLVFFSFCFCIGVWFGQSV